MTREFTSLLRKLQRTNRYTHRAAVKDIAASLQEANKSDLQELLELLISTHDVEIQIKLFSILAAYMINNGVHFEVIVKYNPLYETIQNLLVRGLPMKAAVALNFVIALLSCVEGDASLATHTRNMIRVSGCLNTMSDMFSGSMMYQDTWIALCQSLAEAICDSEINQNYCSHLVSLCVQRCRQGNVDVCSVLQSLLQNHERNLQLFIGSEGVTIFTRQLLQYNMGMQLLNTIVEKSPNAVSMLRKTNIVYHLRDFLHLYGPYSQMGQWSTIILYHLDKGENSIMESSAALRNVRAENVRRLELRQDCTVQIMNEAIRKPKYNTENRVDIAEDQHNIKQINGNNPSNTQLRHARSDFNNKQDDTASLFQNVIKEVIYWKSKENSNRQFTFNNINKKNTGDPYSETRPIVKISRSINRNIEQNNREHAHEKDLTFSFLLKEKSQDTVKQYSITHNNQIVESFMTPGEKSYMETDATSYDKQVQTSTFYNSGYENSTKIGLKNFRPPFISTPKRNKTDQSKIMHRSRTSIAHSRKRVKKPISRPKTLRKFTGTSKQDKSPNATKEIKYRSMSERFFSAINESCTTIVKSMKSIFRSKQDKHDQNNNTEQENQMEEENLSCSYSFTNYMRRRDALLEGEFSQNDESSSENYKVNTCKTCKDTIVLQQKMKKDDHLRQTVRKLKTGINLYGCDFKKISHALWPRDRYMTPEMLYNLYRKLIVKGGHENHSFRLKAYTALRRK